MAVTGCASGIGETTARLAGALGALVVGLDIRRPSIAVETFIPVDLGDPESISAAVSEVGRVDGLFNCAGISGGSADPITVVKVNFLGLRQLTESIVTRMSPGAAVVSISSLGGLGWERSRELIDDFIRTRTFREGSEWCEAHPEALAGGGYGFSKQSLIVYTLTRSVPWAAAGVRVNVIGPSVTDTPMLRDSVKAVGQEFLDNFPRPLGRISVPADQANVLLFLNSDAASYVTGQILWTDGGYTAGVITGQIDPRVR